MTNETFYCPLLMKNIADPLCLTINYAAEGRISSDKVTDVSDWDQAREVCADCVNAYWNKNKLDSPVAAKDMNN